MTTPDMEALRVIADDLTGACDVGAALLPWDGGVLVEAFPHLAATPPMPGALRVQNTQSRTLAPARAAACVRAALVDRGGSAGIVLKKIDTALRGQLGTELDAAMDAVGAAEAFVLAAIPEVGRTTVGGRQLIAGVPVDETVFARDPHNPIDEARVTVALESSARRRSGGVGLDAVRGGRFDAEVARLRARGVAMIVCDAETDADLDACVAALLGRPRPLVLVGSTGLAAALRRALGTPEGPRSVLAASRTHAAGILVVAGSAHPATRAQLEYAVAAGILELVAVRPGRDVRVAGREAARALAGGRTVALTAPGEAIDGAADAVLAALDGATRATVDAEAPGALVLVGGETAFRTLVGLGQPWLAIEASPAPLAVRARLVDGRLAGTPVVTKGGSSGEAGLLARLVRGLT